MLVDEGRARLDLLRESECPIHIRSPDRRAQSVLGTVGPSPNLLPGVECDDGDGRTELLLQHKTRLGVDLRHDRRQHEVPLVRLRPFTEPSRAVHRRTSLRGVPDQLVHLLPLASIVERAHRHVGL